MNTHKIISMIIALSFLAGITLLPGCGGSSRQAGVPLQVEEIDPDEIPGTGSGNSDGGEPDDGQEIPGTSNDSLHPIFQGKLGVPISSSSMGIIDPDPTGLDPCSDYDGDGLANDEEITSNPYIADYPKVVTRISAPITMELRISETSSTENYSETLEEEDISDTREESMDENHYEQANLKTTPVVTKLSSSQNDIRTQSFSFACEQRHGGTDYVFYDDNDVGNSGLYLGGTGNAIVSHGGAGIDLSRSASEDFSYSSSSEKTSFDDINYIDNLDRSGSSLNQNTIQRVSKNYKTSTKQAVTQNIGPNAGIVRASLFIVNATINIPVRVSNILCTLTFKTPAGVFLPVKTFRLRNDDWSVYEQDIYGGEEFGPFTIEIDNLNTNEVKTALRNGYMPQIHVVSYDLSRVDDSNYNPGVDNLKIVEETAKGRTAQIKIVGSGIREMYRVPAFDVDESTDRISPGVSLKKALFHIFRDRVGTGEGWEDEQLTVEDSNLRWMPGAPDPEEHTYTGNTTGNSWTMFETYVKKYKDEYNIEHKIETIKRIGELAKYNPFSVEDNPSYNPNALLTRDEFFKMKYWLIYHNGRYFDGDINDPIWAGERYEIICIDIGEFNNHFETFSYNPLQSQSTISLSTLWNEETNEDEFDRSVYLGKAIIGESIHLELDLKNNRMLFDPAVYETGRGFGEPYQEFTNTDSYELDQGFAWFNFDYTFFDNSGTGQGIPQEFTHKAYGRTNSIIAEIDESEFALEYDVRITDSGSYDRTVRVSKSDLETNRSILAINRKTLDTMGTPLGVISAGTYEVNVTARGIAYGVPVTKTSSSGSISIDVTNYTGTQAGDFTYTATVMTNRIDFQISDANNAEYFLIQYIGPQNPEYGSFTESIVTAHTGYNQIDIPNPVTDPLEPGVYEVHVYSVINGNETLAECTESGTGEYLLVNYDRFSEERSLTPRQVTEYFDQRAIDLEVNFNDGSGWYRLKLSSSQAGEDDRTINCLNTNYMEYNRQKFHIYFQPPMNNEFCSYNVFSGGRDEVDVYIRTVPKPEYRYTTWLKPNPTNCNFIEDAARYVYANASSGANFPGGDVVQYWMENDYTDSSNYEDMLEDRTYASVTELTSVEDSEDIDFGLVPDTEPLATDYFFSPAVYRIYNVRASIIEDDLVAAPAIGAFMPSFKASADKDSIYISQLDYPLDVNELEGLSGYKIYSIQDNHINEDPDLGGWTPVTETDIHPVTGKPAITGLDLFTDYTVCVEAISSGGLSKYAYKLIHTDHVNSDLNLGAETNFNEGSTSFISICNLDETHIAVAYKDEGDSGKGYARIGVISGNTITYGLEYEFNSDTTEVDYVKICALSSSKIVIAFQDTGAGTTYKGIIGTITDTNISFGDEYPIYITWGTDFSICALDSSSFAVAHILTGGSSYGGIWIATVTDTVISLQSQAMCNSASTSNISICALDSSTIAVGYRDDGNSNHGTAIIGTVTGNSISSWGAETEFNSATTSYISMCAMDSSKIAVAFRASDYPWGYAIVGTVTGNTIDFGAQYQYYPYGILGTSIKALDSSTIAIAFTPGDDQSGKLRVGTVNGTEIVFNDMIVFNSGMSYYVSCSILNTHTILIGYRDNGDLNYGKTIVLSSSRW